ncbi:hypothetical protein EJP67_32960 [Variovorax guangxiensis]|uniref:DUF2868 domain-containing protein n=1 Tax=Variovorax guangxiensis TaxID=1775474 RepID=A0A433MVL9_9BURK|nr:hypothetical protein [Variovorax guangxiensis]RUR71868.1 hypothetical protein EJP67_32960 [Variovorax guangxiensis]
MTDESLDPSTVATSTARSRSTSASVLEASWPGYGAVLFATIAALLVSAAFVSLRGWTWLDVLICVATAALSSIAVASYLQRKDAGYTARIDAESAQAWRVEMNGVEIGRMSDREFATMQQLVHRRSWNAIAQLLNVIWTVISSATAVLRVLLVAIPLAAFWSWLVIQVFVNPDATSQFLRYLGNGGAQQIPEIAGRFASLAIALIAFGYGLYVVSTGPLASLPGYRNHYTEDLHRRLRQHFKTAAAGNIVVLPNGYVVAPAATQQPTPPMAGDTAEVSEDLAASVHNITNAHMWQAMLQAFQYTAFQHGFELVHGGIAAQIPFAVKSEIGNAVIVARWRHLGPTELAEKVHERLQTGMLDGADIAFAEHVIAALDKLGISICRVTSSHVDQAGDLNTRLQALYSDTDPATLLNPANPVVKLPALGGDQAGRDGEHS